MAEYYRERDRIFRLTELKVPADIRPYMEDDAVLSG
jgi:hypothetical protein